MVFGNSGYWKKWCIRFALFFAGFTSVCVGAFADPEFFNTIHPYASLSESYSSNLLDLANSAQALQVLGSPQMSDRWTTEVAGVAMDDLIGLQRVTADLSKSKSVYERYRELNYVGTNAQGNWKWAVGEHVSGDLGASYSQAPSSFAYFHDLQQPLLDTKQQVADFAWLFHPSWRVVGSLTGYELMYLVPIQQQYSRNEYHAMGGFDYVTPNGSSVGVLVGNLRTYFPVPQQFGNESIVNNNKQDEFKLNVNWIFSGLSTVQFLGGWVERKYDILKQDDYRGWNGRFTSTWLPTGSLSVVTMAWHEIGAIDLLTTVYAVNRGVSVAPIWNATSKLSLQAKLAFERHEFAATEQPYGLPVISTSSKTRNESAQLTYQITPHWNAQGTAYYSSQSTSDQSNDFHGTGLQLATSFKF